MFEKLKTKMAKRIKNKKLVFAGLLTWLIGVIFMIIGFICLIFVASSAGIVFVCLSMIFIPGCLIVSKGTYSKEEIKRNEQIEMINAADRAKAEREEKLKNNIYSKLDDHYGIIHEHSEECFSEVEIYFKTQLSSILALMNNTDCNSAIEKLFLKKPKLRFNSLIMYCLPLSYNEKMDWVELKYDDDTIRKYIKNRINELKSQNNFDSIEYKLCKLYSNIICNIGIEENGRREIVSKLDYFDLDDYYLGNSENGVQEIETLYYGLLANGLIQDISLSDFYIYMQLKISEKNHDFCLTLCQKYGLSLNTIENDILKLLSSVDKHVNLLSLDADWDTEEKFENNLILYLKRHPNNYLFNLLGKITLENNTVKYEFLSICFSEIFSCDFEVCTSLAHIVIDSFVEMNKARKNLEDLLGTTNFEDENLSCSSNAEKTKIIPMANIEKDDSKILCQNDIKNDNPIGGELNFSELEKVFAIMELLQEIGQDELRMKVFSLYEECNYPKDNISCNNAKSKLRGIIKNVECDVLLKQVQVKKLIDILSK